MKKTIITMALLVTCYLLSAQDTTNANVNTDSAKVDKNVNPAQPDSSGVPADTSGVKSNSGVNTNANMDNASTTNKTDNTNADANTNANADANTNAGVNASPTANPTDANAANATDNSNSTTDKASTTTETSSANVTDNSNVNNNSTSATNAADNTVNSDATNTAKVDNTSTKTDNSSANWKSGQVQANVAATPLLATFVPDAVVAKFKEKYGSGLYDITMVKKAPDTFVYVVRTQDGGTLKTETVNDQGNTQ